MNNCCFWLILLALIGNGNCGCNNCGENAYANNTAFNTSNGSGCNNCCNSLWIIILLLIFGCGNNCGSPFGLNNCGCNNCGCN